MKNEFFTYPEISVPLETTIDYPYAKKSSLDSDPELNRELERLAKHLEMTETDFYAIDLDKLDQEQRKRLSKNLDQMLGRIGEIMQSKETNEPLIGLVKWFYLNGEKYKEKLEKGEILTASIKLSEPNLKILNGLIGIQKTNEFLEDLHTGLNNLLTSHKVEILDHPFKGTRCLVIEFHGDTKKNISDDLVKFQKNTIPALIGKRAAEQLKYLNKVLTEKNTELKNPSPAAGENTRLSEEIAQIKTNINHLNQFLTNSTENTDELLQFEIIPEPNIKARLSLGYNNIIIENQKPENINPYNLALSTQLTEVGTNLSERRYYQDRKEGKQNERKLLAEFVPEYYFMDLIQTYADIIERLHNPELKQANENFFQTDETGALMPLLTENIIQKLRKLDKYATSMEYENCKETIPHFEETLEFLKINIYKLINTLDVIKNYTLENFQSYSEKIKKIAKKLIEAKSLIGTDKIKEKISLLENFQEELKKPLKALEIEQRCNRIEYIKKLIQNLIFFIMMGDMKNFGAQNIKELQDSIWNLLNLLKEENKEIAEILDYKNKNGSKRKLARDNYNFRKNLVIETFTQLHENQAKFQEFMQKFYEIIFEAGDKTTKKNSETRKKLVENIPKALSFYYKNSILNITDETTGQKFTLDPENIKIFVRSDQGDEIDLAAAKTDNEIQEITALNHQTHTNSSDFTFNPNNLNPEIPKEPTVHTHGTEESPTEYIQTTKQVQIKYELKIPNNYQIELNLETPNIQNYNPYNPQNIQYKTTTNITLQELNETLTKICDWLSMEENVRIAGFTRIARPISLEELRKFEKKAESINEFIKAQETGSPEDQTTILKIKS